MEGKDALDVVEWMEYNILTEEGDLLTTIMLDLRISSALIKENNSYYTIEIGINEGKAYRRDQTRINSICICLNEKTYKPWDTVCSESGVAIEPVDITDYSTNLFDYTYNVSLNLVNPTDTYLIRIQYLIKNPFRKIEEIERELFVESRCNVRWGDCRSMEKTIIVPRDHYYVIEPATEECNWLGKIFSGEEGNFDCVELKGKDSIDKVKIKLKEKQGLIDELISYITSPPAIFAVILLVLSLVVKHFLRQRHTTKQQEDKRGKEHFAELKEKVVNPWLTELEKTYEGLEYMVTRFIEPSDVVHPTDLEVEKEKLFGDIENHYEELIRKWVAFKKDLSAYNDLCLSFSERIKNQLSKETILPICDTYDTNKKFIHTRFIDEIYKKIILNAGGGRTILAKEFKIRLTNHAAPKPTHELYYTGTVYSVGSEKEMEKCIFVYNTLVELPENKVRGGELVKKAGELEKKIGDIKDRLREVIHQTKLPGNCPYV